MQVNIHKKGNFQKQNPYIYAVGRNRSHSRALSKRDFNLICKRTKTKNFACLYPVLEILYIVVSYCCILISDFSRISENSL